MPRNAYEITKQLQIMNVSSWYNIANSTVYATLKTLEKKEYIYGIIEKMEICQIKLFIHSQIKGKEKLLETLEQSILSFDYDTNVFFYCCIFSLIF